MTEPKNLKEDYFKELFKQQKEKMAECKNLKEFVDYYASLDIPDDSDYLFAKAVRAFVLEEVEPYIDNHHQRMVRGGSSIKEQECIPDCPRCKFEKMRKAND